MMVPARQEGAAARGSFLLLATAAIAMAGAGAASAQVFTQPPAPAKPRPKARAKPAPLPAPVVRIAPKPTARFAPVLPPVRFRFVLSEDNAKSIWSTSVFSYTGKGGGPGGGLADDKLRVGGWGDQYVSLIRFDLPSERVVKAAVLRLMVKGEGPGSTSRPTPLNLRIIDKTWTWRQGDRLWWRNLPVSTPARQLPGPGDAGSVYELDITDIYNQWVSGQRENNGIMLTPVLTDNNYSTFHSTRAPEHLRPVLELAY